jgi:tol-pal system protein YbgF
LPPHDHGTYNSGIVRVSLAAFLLTAALSACAGPATQLRRENARLDEDVAQLRADLRREKRKSRDLETENLVLRDKLETVEIGAGRVGDVPRLPVEVLAPDDEGAPDAGDGEVVVSVGEDGTEVVYVGDAATGKSAEAPEDLELIEADDLEYAPDDDDVVAPPPRAPAKAKPARARPGRTSPRARRDDAPARGDRAVTAYEAAVAKVKAKDHDGAITALRGFLEAYPRHELADNARYWLGEVYYDAKDWARAAVEFRATIEDYPRGNKVPDALLKLGFCFAALGQDAKAKAALEQVIETYPRTQPAELAAKRLEDLK